MNRELLKNRKYVYLLSAQTVSNLGDWLNILALFALIGLKWHASPLALSIAMLCLAVPSIIFGSFVGTIADRFDRKTLMITADLLRAAVVLGIIFSTQLWQVYILLCMKSIFSAVFEPAKEGKLKEIVSDDLMQPAVATSELVNNGAKIIGPILSGILVAGVGIQWSFYLDSFSFVLSALLLIGVPRTKKIVEVESADKKEGPGFFRQFTDGFAFLKQKPALLVGLFVFSLMMLVLQISDSQMIILLREIQGDPVSIMGWIMAASGAGVIGASMILNRKEIHSYLRVLSLSSVGLGLGYVFSGTFIHLPVIWISTLYPILGVVMGFCFGMALIPFNVMAQKMTPDRYTGRVFGTIGSVTTLAVVIGMLSGGLLSEAFGVIFTYIFAGSLLVLVGIIVYSLRRRLQGRDVHAEGNTGAHRKAEG
ncbi:MAG TPA: MFS transporter [Bacillales bacterium]|nr:MFS transporter [Bacillales bacterium]